MTHREPLIVDFSPHVIHYAGAFEGRWFVSLFQYPTLLAFDERGELLQRLECPNVETVVAGRFAIGSTRPRVKVANVQRAPDLGLRSLTCHDLLSEKELWRRESARLVYAMGTTGIVVSGSGSSETTTLVDLATGTVLWESGEALVVHAHDERNVYAEDREGVLLALDRRTGDLAWSLKSERPRSGLVSAWRGGVAAGADGVWYVRPVAARAS